MSLNRTALRLQTIQALNADLLLDRIVEGRVFDSRISAISTREVVPVILVTTEETSAESYDRQNGGGPFNLSCDLVLELAMNVVSGAGDAEVIGVVTTDGKLEARLDLLEDRIAEVLAPDQGDFGAAERMTPAGRLLHEAVVRRIGKFGSSRFVTDEVGQKLAIRIITFRVELLPGELSDPFAPPSGPYAAFPKPLRRVAEALPPGFARQTCDFLIADLVPPSPPPAPGFTGVDLTFAPQSLGATPPSRSDDIGAGRVILATANP